MEKLFKGIKPQKMKKDEIAAFIYNHCEDITEFMIRKGHIHKFKDSKERVFKFMANEKTVKGIKLVMKRAKKEPEYALPIEFVRVICDYLEWANRQSNKEELEEINDAYFEIVSDLLDKKAKKISKKTGLGKEVVKELLAVCPSDKYITEDKSGRAFIFAVQKMARKLYILAKSTEDVEKEDNNLKSVLGVQYDNVKSLKKTFEAILGKKRLPLLAVAILLEKKEFIKEYNQQQVFMWNRVADIAIEIIETCGKKDKKEAVSILQQYATFRAADDKNGRDGSRHVNIMSLPCENFPNIFKAAKKVADKNKRLAEYL